MKAKIFLMVVTTGVILSAGIANADQAVGQPVSLQNIRLLEEETIKSSSDRNSISWERSWERRERGGWERRERGGWERRHGWWERR